jgi:hypothetical protein
MRERECCPLKDINLDRFRLKVCDMCVSLSSLFLGERMSSMESSDLSRSR